MGNLLITIRLLISEISEIIYLIISLLYYCLIVNFSMILKIELLI